MGSQNLLFAAFLAFVSAERLWATRASRHAERGQKQQAWSLPVFYVLHIAILVSVATEYFWMRRTLVLWVTGLGMVLFGASLLLRSWAIHTLGKFWSLHVEIREQHRLIRDGPYRYVRHPAYVAIIMEFIGIPLVGNCYYSLIPVFALFFPFLAVRILYEERALVAKFGEDYLAYRKQAGVLWPRFWVARPQPDAEGGGALNRPR